MLLEKPADAFRGEIQLPLLAQVVGDLLEAPLAMLDMFDQNPDRSLRAQGRRRTRGLRSRCLLALPAIEFFGGRKVAKLALDLDAIQRAGLVEVS